MTHEPRSHVGTNRQFLRYAFVGGSGFVVDASVLTFLVIGLGYGHYVSRIASFSLAVTATWWINRRWVFETGAPSKREYSGYFAVQLLGAVINLGIYVLTIELVPALATIPVLPLAIGAVVALLANFYLVRRFVFRHSRTEDSTKMKAQPESEFKYSGVENLEAMKQARNYNRFLLDLVKRNLVGHDVLDFGAGTGTFALPLKSAGISVTCVEPDGGLRSSLSSSGLAAYPDISHIPVKSLDCTYSMNVLEHIEDDRAALEAIHERIRPEGRIIIYVPAFNILYSKMDELVGHRRRYRRKDLVAKIEDAGFKVDTATYVDSLGFFVALVYRWIGNDSGVISSGSVKMYDRILFPLSRILDRLLFGSFGKNLLVVGTRPY